ncbi:MAG TPA: DUF2249 domain-containing protein [Noviherbaspirillum sp.]|nr:DUF2249 domain-containing protein [Noviherbaspirillum sp.]
MNQDDNDIILDVCGLEPPEPLERVLDALSRMEPGQRVRMIIGREPIPLYQILQRNNYNYQTRCRDDYLYEVLIWEKDKI